MAEYVVVDGKDPYITGWLLSALTEAKDGRGALAKWAQQQLDGMVKVGYINPTVTWAVRDTKYGRFQVQDLPSKAAALEIRRSLGGNSARYRVEPVHPVAPPEQP